MEGAARDKKNDSIDIISLKKSGKTAFYISKELIRIDCMRSKKECCFDLLTFYENCYINIHNLKKLIAFLSSNPFCLVWRTELF